MSPALAILAGFALGCAVTLGVVVLVFWRATH